MGQLLRERPKLRATASPSDVVSWLAEMGKVTEETHALVEEIRAFQGWADLPFHVKPAAKQAKLTVAAFKEWRSDKASLVQAVKTAQRRPRGHPAERRHLAI